MHSGTAGRLQPGQRRNVPESLHQSTPVQFGSDLNRPGQADVMGMACAISTAQPSRSRQRTFAEFLAQGTGGESLALSEKLPAQLAAIAREQDEYYRVAYTPPPAKDGSCHKLRVATAPRGLTIRARNEYCTEKQIDLVAGSIAGQGLESRAAAGGAGNPDCHHAIAVLLHRNKSRERASCRSTSCPRA